MTGRTLVAMACNDRFDVFTYRYRLEMEVGHVG
ncbi:MAG: hypothetical protein K0S54_1541 [Alphaproteobacteria bacterium]|jgi:hypothetical protein|nr:hypothetical protein [Alphaproteobacteria bacterium]